MSIADEQLPLNYLEQDGTIAMTWSQGQMYLRNAVLMHSAL